MSQLLIINADDFGLTDGVCQAIVELGQAGGISSTTAMLGVPEALTRIHRYWNNLSIPCGVHLHVTYGAPTHPKAPPRTQKHLKAPQCATSYKQSKQTAPFRGAFWRFSALYHHNQTHPSSPVSLARLAKSGGFSHKDTYALHSRH